MTVTPNHTSNQCTILYQRDTQPSVVGQCPPPNALPSSPPPPVLIPSTSKPHDHSQVILDGGEDELLTSKKKKLSSFGGLPEAPPVTNWGSLTLKHYSEEGESVEVFDLILPCDKYSVGRGPDCNLRFKKNSFLGRRHLTLKLSCKNPRWNTNLVVTIQDHGSKNGTVVNSTKLVPNKPTILHDGDVIHLPKHPHPPRNSVESLCLVFSRVRTRSLHEKYMVKERIGEGHYSKVHRGVCWVSKTVVAIKLLVKPRREDETTQLLQIREMGILNNAAHPFICTVLDIVETPEKLGLVLELTPHGDLFDYLESNGNLSLEQFIWVFFQILSAFRYLHGNHITHRDIKPENVLVVDKDKLLMQVSDFGLARYFDDEAKFDTLLGSLPYAAPEVNNFRLYRSYNASCDMWGIGVMMFKAITGKLPFNFESRSIAKKDVENLFNGEFDLITPDVEDIIESLLVFKPSDRSTANEALDHPLFFWNLPLIKDLIQIEHNFVAPPTTFPHTPKYPPVTTPPKPILP